MAGEIAEQWALLPALLSGHLLLTICALAVGIGVSVPLGIAAAASDRISRVALTVAGLVQTIPSIALLALMVPILAGTIGFLPAFLALTVYSVLPILRNTVTGIRGIDPACTEAARAVGMTARQQLVKVDLPLAFPVIIAGIRTSAVWVVGTATLATPVGAASLGNYIFAGLQTRNVTAVLFGCFFAAALAIVLDQILGLIESGIAKRQRGRVNVAVAALASVFIVGLAPVAFDRAPASSFSSPELSGDSVTQQAPLGELSVVIGSKAFTEQYILSDLLADYLRSYGIAVSTRQGLGSTVLFDALSKNSIDLYVEYTGTIWSAILKEPDFPDRRELQLRTELKVLSDYGILSMGRLGFENAYALAMRRAQADALGIVTLFDLAAHSADLRFAGDDEFFAREEWRRVRDAYGLRPAEQRVMDPTFFYEAIGNGTVDVISAYTSDGRIDAYDLLIVDDALGAFPPYDAVLLLSPRASQHRELKRVLSRLVNRIDQAAMRRANRRVDVDGDSPSAAAAELLGNAF